MLRNYIKIALRNLLRHKAFSFINIFGLAIGMACTILILLWVEHELSYDKFHQNPDNVYRITARLPEMDIKAAVSSAPLGPAVRAEIPEIKDMVRISFPHRDLMQVEEKMFEESLIMYADSNFLKFFPYVLKAGDARTALLQPEGIVITEAMAIKYFGTTDAMGKVIRKNHETDHTVTGVLANVPENSHLQFDFIQPMSFLARTNDDLKKNVWDNFNFFTYIELNRNTSATTDDLEKLEAKFNQIYVNNEKNLKVVFHLQPLTEIHLKSNFLADLEGHGNIQYVYTFVIIAIFILGVACINFMNLATARSARRAKEVGLRKVAGAVRFQIIRQFLAESSLIAFLALILAIILVSVALPAFNDLAGKNLHIDYLNGKQILSVLGITLLTGLLAGSYPALFLSGFIPVKVLKGNLKAGASGSAFRNTMVIIQFAVSISLIVGTAVIFQQMQFIHNRNIGFDKENLVYVRMTGEAWKNYQTLRTTLEQNSMTSDFCVASDVPTYMTNGTISVVWDGKNPESQPLFCNLAIDEKFVDVFHLTLLSGRNFSKDIKADSSNLIVNEKALEIMNMTPENAIGKSISLWENKGTIIGVVKDFNFKPAHKPIEALLLRYNTWGGAVVVRAKPQQVEATVAQVEKIFKTINPSYPFSYNFIDQELNNLYKSEQRLSSLFTIFAGLAIFISCLGLYGLSAFLAERRTKEMGVRKVLGASTSHIVFLLSRTFTVPVLIAMLIATPLSWYAMTLWLEGFAFHVDISWSVFVIAFLISLLIAILTVSYESIKVAFAEPATSMREE